MLIGLNVFLALCLVIAGTLYGYVSYRFGQIHRVTISSLFGGAVPSGGSTGGGSAGPPQNILLVGSDTRSGLTQPGDKAFGSGAVVAGARSDTIMIVHLNPADGTASLLSIPRDLWVPIPGHGTNRINSAFDNGAADLLVRTIQDDLGIPINHYVEVDFDTFRQVVNALGGVKFWYPEPVRDDDNGVNDSGLNITTPGCYTLTGNMALSLVRTRHMVYYSDGRWHTENESDLARIRRQQLFIRKVIAKAKAQGLNNITKINGVVGGIVSNLTIDSGFSQSEMIVLARRYRNFNPSNLPSATLPTTQAVIGGADVLLLQKDQAQQVINVWEGLPAAGTAPAAAGPVPALNPSTITVGVLNGSGVSHQASQAAQALSSAGFNASISGSGQAPNFNYGTSVVEYAPSDQVTAVFVQSKIAGGAQLQSDSNLRPGTVILITGASYQGITSGSGSAAAPKTSPTSSTTPAAAGAAALATLPGNTSNSPAFPGPHGQDPPPPGSGC